MKSWSMRMLADGATIEKVEAPMPEPGAQQLLVRVRAAGLNRGEFIVGHGLQKPGTTKAIGMEAAGEVAKAGPGVTGFKPGDRVMGRCAGAFSEYALMDVREAMPMPAPLSFEQAAVVPLTFLVAQDMLLDQGRLKSGEWVLVTGISSGVGVSALQAAKALGARVIGTSGSQEKLARLKPLGLDVGILTRGPDFLDPVMRETGGKGVDLVVNTVGGTMFAECIRCLAFEGRLATVGYVDDTLKAEIDIQALHMKRLTLFGVSNKLRNAEQRASGVPRFVRDLLPAIADGRIVPLVDRAFAFDELAAAKEHMESNRHAGKIVLSIS
jgi:NADPH:quinone reductase-like Zn-dependent oxidoreductase